MLDRDGSVSSWNAGAERIKGYKANEILGRHCSYFFTAEDIAANKPWQRRDHGTGPEEGAILAHAPGGARA